MLDEGRIQYILYTGRHSPPSKVVTCNPLAPAMVVFEDKHVSTTFPPIHDPNFVFCQSRLHTVIFLSTGDLNWVLGYLR